MIYNQIQAEYANQLIGYRTQNKTITNQPKKMIQRCTEKYKSCKRIKRHKQRKRETEKWMREGRQEGHTGRIRSKVKHMAYE